MIFSDIIADSYLYRAAGAIIKAAGEQEMCDSFPGYYILFNPKSGLNGFTFHIFSQ